MKKKIISLIMVMAMACSCILFTGCGQTLEEYFEKDSTLLDEIANQTTNEGLAIDVEKNTLIYTYDISTIEGMTEELATGEKMQASLQATLDDSEETFSGMCADLEEQSEIKNIEILVRYNYKKQVIASKVFKAS